jgi:hypothetical protein
MRTSMFFFCSEMVYLDFMSYVMFKTDDERKQVMNNRNIVNSITGALCAISLNNLYVVCALLHQKFHGALASVHCATERRVSLMKSKTSSQRTCFPADRRPCDQSSVPLSIRRATNSRVTSARNRENRSLRETLRSPGDRVFREFEEFGSAQRLFGDTPTILRDQRVNRRKSNFHRFRR